VIQQQVPLPLPCVNFTQIAHAAMLDLEAAKCNQAPPTECALRA